MAVKCNANANANAGRLATLMNKARELNTFCGVDVCVVYVDPSSGNVSTWPDDKPLAVSILQRYKKLSCTDDPKKPNKRRARASPDLQSSAPVSVTAKKRRLSPDPQSSSAAAIPTIRPNCSVIGNDGVDSQLGLGSSSSQEACDMGLDYWYSDSGDVFFGSDCDHGLEIGSGLLVFGSNTHHGDADGDDGFGISSSLEGQVKPIETEIEQEPQLLERKEPIGEVEIELEPQLDLHFDLCHWNDLPQLAHVFCSSTPTPTSCDFDDFSIILS